MSVGAFLRKEDLPFFFISLILSIAVSSVLIVVFKPKTSIPKITPKNTFIVKGSIPYWDQEDAFVSYQQNSNVISYINLFWYYMMPDGTVRKYTYAREDEKIISYAHSHNTKVSAAITNLPEFSGATWDSSRVEDVVKNSKIRAYHILQIVNKLNEFQFDGVVIDYESVHARSKNNYTQFIEELAVALRKEKKELAVALHPKVDDADRKGNGGFQDWKKLSNTVDQLHIMGYGEHWEESEAGPIGSVPWVLKILRYAKKLNIPPEKMFLGIPLYGYDWNTSDDSKANGLTYYELQILLANYDAREKWDATSESPFFWYRNNNQNHEVWYENAKSIHKKVHLARQAGFKGVTFWRLGKEDPEMWNSLVY